MDTLSLRDLVDELFNCLGPLRSCAEPIQDYLVYPYEEYVVDPIQANCIDPVSRYLEVNPLGCVPCLGLEPSLPQYDTPEQQDRREAQLTRTQPYYQYNYDLVRTYKVVDGVGKQGPGLAALANLPLTQLPSLCFIALALRQALVIVENFLAVLELLRKQSKQAAAPVAYKDSDETEEPGLVAVTTNNTATPVSSVEIEQHLRQLTDLRFNFQGTLDWSHRVASSLSPVSSPTVEPAGQQLRAPAPPRETADGSTGLCSLSTCSCLRCSPQNFTRQLFDDIKTDVNKIAYHLLSIPALNTARPLSIRAYNELFQVIPLPKFAETFRDDEEFALERVAGQNPLVLERADWEQWKKKIPVTAAQYKKVMGDDDSLDAASTDGRLYICDYQESLGNSIAGAFPDFAGQKYINAPLALFALEKSDRRVIKAVAIQCGQVPGDKNPVITPDGGWNWEIAKTIVQNADCNDSEYFRHLGRAHLLTEAFILATYRQLPRKHPLFVLLTPHFEGTLFTNNLAVTSINQAGSPLNITEMIFSGTVPSTLGIAGNAVHTLNFNENMLPNQLRGRGVDDPKVLPNYPYRDDARLIWNAIRNWAEDYIRLYYRNDDDVIGDYELQNWVAEVSSQQGGRIQGVGEDGFGNRIETRAYLIDCIAQVIYNASAHHALTNFPLDDFEIYAPGFPGALYKPAPTAASGASRAEWLDYLAPLSIALLQQALGRLVGSTYFTQLGKYPICQFDDARVRVPLRAFQDDLREIEQIIRERNARRVMPYPYLLPSRIPQSTNI
jgi:arachidonate 15-lipoxygenase